jgi:hypothetical protein
MSTILLFAGTGILGALLYWHMSIVEAAQRTLTGEQLKLLTTTAHEGAVRRFAPVVAIALGGLLMFIFPNHRLVCFGLGLVGSLIAVVASGAEGISTMRASGLPETYIMAVAKARSVFIAFWILLSAILFYAMRHSNVGS